MPVHHAGVLGPRRRRGHDRRGRAGILWNGSGRRVPVGVPPDTRIPDPVCPARQPGGSRWPSPTRRARPLADRACGHLSQSDPGNDTGVSGRYASTASSRIRSLPSRHRQHDPRRPGCRPCLQPGVLATAIVAATDANAGPDAGTPGWRPGDSRRRGGHGGSTTSGAAVSTPSLSTVVHLTGLGTRGRSAATHRRRVAAGHPDLLPGVAGAPGILRLRAGRRAGGPAGPRPRTSPPRCGWS